jgi:hypothetical protein
LTTPEAARVDHNVRAAYAWAALGILAMVGTFATRLSGDPIGLALCFAVLALANIKAWRRYVDANWPGHRAERRNRKG